MIKKGKVRVGYDLMAYECNLGMMMRSLSSAPEAHSFLVWLASAFLASIECGSDYEGIVPPGSCHTSNLNVILKPLILQLPFASRPVLPPVYRHTSSKSYQTIVQFFCSF
jgi:hypothetical protein